MSTPVDQEANNEYSYTAPDNTNDQVASRHHQQRQIEIINAVESAESLQPHTMTSKHNYFVRLEKNSSPDYKQERQMRGLSTQIKKAQNE